MPQKKLLLQAAIALLAVWAVFGLISKMAGKQVVTREKVIEFIQKNPLPPEGEKEKRDRIVEELAAKVNRLSMEERQLFREEGGNNNLRKFTENLTEAERDRFVELTIDEHFKAVFAALNKMKPEERKDLVDKIMRDMNKDQAKRPELERMREHDQQMAEKITEKGMSAYYKDAKADVKRDLAPVLEEMQHRLQTGMRR